MMIRPGIEKMQAIVASFTTWDPSDKTANTTLSNGNLTITGNSNNARGRATALFTGNHYWETYITTAGVASMGIGNGSLNIAGTAYLGNDANAAALYFPDGSVYLNGSAPVAAGNIPNGTLLRHAFRTSSGKYWIGVGASGWISGDPAADTSPCVTVSGSGWRPAYDSRGTTATANFGASAFTGTVPSGFTAGVPA